MHMVLGAFRPAQDAHLACLYLVLALGLLEEGAAAHDADQLSVDEEWALREDQASRFHLGHIGLVVAAALYHNSDLDIDLQNPVQSFHCNRHIHSLVDTRRTVAVLHIVVAAHCLVVAGHGWVVLDPRKAAVGHHSLLRMP
jgi:hypothetical protein